jgi:hypothetical protein
MLTINKLVLPSPEQWEIIIEGMRNPMNSWDKTDSYSFGVHSVGKPGFMLGENDLSLMERLANAGSDHRKYMRMTPIWVTVTAPLYFWKEYDTYKVGTVANSCSTMHKIHANAFSIDDFSCDHLLGESMDDLRHTIDRLNFWRDVYLNGSSVLAPKSKTAWWQLIQLLPSSYNQKRTLFLNYEVLRNIYRARRNHKLDEWHTFCDFIETLPYSELITGEVSDNLCTT